MKFHSRRRGPFRAVKKFWTAALLAAAALGGCVVQSFHPFYTAKARIPMPHAGGEWVPVRLAGHDVSESRVKPWTFTEKEFPEYDGMEVRKEVKVEIVTFDDHNIPGRMTAVYFKVGEWTFCDAAAGALQDPGTGQAAVNAYWLYSVTLAHVLCKVTVKKDVIVLAPLDFDWLKEKVQKKEVDLPYVGNWDPNGRTLVTATPEEWQKFLEKHGGDDKAFPQDEGFVLARVPEGPGDEKPAPDGEGRNEDRGKDGQREEGAKGAK